MNITTLHFHNVENLWNVLLSLSTLVWPQVTGCTHIAVHSCIVARLHRCMKAEFQAAHSHGLKMLFSADDEILCQVTNYPKFLRDIELYGRSEITHMEERIIDFPEDLQDLFDKNPEVFISPKYSALIDVEIIRSVRTTWSSRTRHTPRWRERAASSSLKGGRWESWAAPKIRLAKLQLGLDKRNFFSHFDSKIISHPGHKWYPREPLGDSTRQPCSHDLSDCGGSKSKVQIV